MSSKASLSNKGIRKSSKMTRTSKDSISGKGVRKSSLVKFVKKKVTGRSKKSMNKTPLKKSKVDSIYSGAKRVKTPGTKNGRKKFGTPNPLFGPFQNLSEKKKYRELRAQDNTPKKLNFGKEIFPPQMDEEEDFEFSKFETDGSANMDGIYEDFRRYHELLNAFRDLKRKGNIQNFTVEKCLEYFKEKCPFFPY